VGPHEVNSTVESVQPARFARIRGIPTFHCREELFEIEALKLPAKDHL